MEIDLNRLDLAHAGQPERGTLALFGGGKSGQQKVIVGDRTGVVQCFGIKKTDSVPVFKTLPLNQKISSVTSGWGMGQKDKVYLASDQTIRGMNKRGKEFFRFATNLTERITKVIVEDENMWLAGEFNFNQYLDCKDRHFYMSPDKINDMQLVNVSAGGPFVGLGCQDRTVRMLFGNEVYYEIAIGGPVNSLAANEVRDAALQSAHQGEKELLYGTTNGQIGQVLMNSESIRRGWLMESDQQGDGISAMECNTDFTKDGMPDIVVGRLNGGVEVWALDEAYEPHKVMTKTVNESVLSLDSGFVCAPDAQDIVLQTYSGKVIAFTNSQLVYSAPPDLSTGGAAARGKPVTKEVHIKGLQGDINELKMQLAQAKETADSLAHSSPVVSGNVLETRHSFLLDEKNSGKYILTVESPVPLFGLALQADVSVRLLEDSGTAIVSHSPPDIAAGSMCLASYRCQESVNRVEVHMEVVEGQHGTIHAFVIPAAPPKQVTVVTCRLKPLCLHCRVDHPASAATPLNELRISGDFQTAEVHEWIAVALPEVSGRAPIQDDNVMHFKSTLIGSSLTCKYGPGFAVFSSDGVSSLAILRETISREANAAKARVSITYQLNQGSIAHLMNLLWPKLSEQRGLAKKVSVMEALQELKMQDGDVSYLSNEQKDDLKNADKLREALAAQPGRLQYLFGVVKDLFIDWHKFNGSGPASSKRIPELDRLLQDPTSEKSDVVRFIMTS